MIGLIWILSHEYESVEIKHHIFLLLLQTLLPLIFITHYVSEKRGFFQLDLRFVRQMLHFSRFFPWKTMNSNNYIQTGLCVYSWVRYTGGFLFIYFRVFRLKVHRVAFSRCIWIRWRASGAFFILFFFWSAFRLICIDFILEVDQFDVTLLLW